jgi:hypothetical protein
MNPEDIPIRDLHLPEMIAWWPVASGWWVLFVLLLFAFGFIARRALQNYHMNTARRRAISQLRHLQAEYERSHDAVLLGIRISKLLRRVMLAYAPRDEVAGLTGKNWLEWLDQGLASKVFTDGPGHNIESLPYFTADLDTRDIDVDGLIQAVRQRFKTPRSRSI